MSAAAGELPATYRIDPLTGSPAAAHLVKPSLMGKKQTGRPGNRLTGASDE
jgi:hypothetical protein